MQLAIEHRTRLHYDAEVSYSILSLRLTPASFNGQTVLDWTISSSPSATLAQDTDGFGNTTHLMTIVGAHRDLEIVAAGVVAAEDRLGIVDGLAERTPIRLYLRRTALTERDPQIMALASGLNLGDPVGDMHDLMATIRERVECQAGQAADDTPAGEVLTAGTGTCQDLTHIFLAVARASGIPARYVTGYLLEEKEEAAVAHHAWAEAWIDGLGWVGFDVANGLCPTDHYVRLAAGLDSTYAAPVRSSRSGAGQESLRVELTVGQNSQQ